MKTSKPIFSAHCLESVRKWIKEQVNEDHLVYDTEFSATWKKIVDRADDHDPLHKEGNI